MKKTTTAKIIFDVALTVIMLLLMAYSLTGGTVHEIMGLVALGLFLLHKLFNGKWIVRVTKKVFTGGCDGFNAVKYVVDILFLILMIAAGGSGILISNHVLTGITVFDRTTWIYIHRLASYSSLIVMSVHIGLHWELIMAAFRNMLGLNKNCKSRKLVLRILAFIMALLGIRANADKDFLAKFTPDDSDTETETTDTIDKTGFDYNDDVDDENGQTIVGNNAEEASYTSKTAQFIEQTRGMGTAEYDFSSNPPTSSESEQEYLGRLNCTGCGKHCLLTNPQCNTGSQLANQGSAYYQSYSKSSETTITTTQPQTETQTETQTDTETETETDTDTSTVTSQALTDEQSSLVDDSTDDKAANNEKTDSSYLSSDSTADSVPSLEEYLGKLYCSGCGRHCSLLSPQCDKGASQAQQATADYNNTYQSGSSSAENEVIFDDDAIDSLKNLFGTMIPVMCLYVCGTYYIVKFAKRH